MSAGTELGLPGCDQLHTGTSFQGTDTISWRLGLDHAGLQGLPSFGIGRSEVWVGNSGLLQ